MVKSFYIESQSSQMLNINKIINNLVLDNFGISRMASLLMCPFYFLFLPFVGVHILKPFLISLKTESWNFE